MTMYIQSHEKQARLLNDPQARQETLQKYANYRVSFIPWLLGKSLVIAGNLLYGRKPSYTKFRAIEIIARIPYQSWEVFSYCAQTVFFSDESRAIRLANISEFARVAQDNETMHVVVISQLMREHGDTRLMRTTLLPMIGSFVYFYFSFILYLLNKRYSFELNYMFEQHAYEQYQRFLEENETTLKETVIHSHFLKFYGRNVANEYEFFELVRNDELLHRNASVEHIESVK